MHKTGGFLHIQRILKRDTKRARRDKECAPQQKAVYVYFWASWCDMSREELPVVQTMYDQYGEDCGFIVASVEAEDTVSTVEALKQTLGLTTLPMGTGGLDAFLTYEQPGIPFSVLIDADGTVRAMHLGVATAEGRLDALDDIR